MRAGVRILAVLVGVVVMVVGLLAFRLSRRPVPLDFLTPRVEAALAPAGVPYGVRIGGAQVGWAGRSGGLELRAVDVQVRAADGKPIATFDSVEIDLDAWALLRGSLVPEGIEVVRPTLRLVRHPGGTIDLGLGGAGETAPEGDTSLLSDLVGRLSSEGGADPPGAGPRLRSLAVRDATVSLADLESGEQIDAPDLDLRLARDAEGIVATLSGRVVLSGDRSVSEGSDGEGGSADGDGVAFSGKALRREDGAGTRAELVVWNVRPAALAAHVRRFPDAALALRLDELTPVLERVDLALDGRLEADLDATWRPRRAGLELSAPAGTLVLGDGSGAREALRDLAVEIDVDLVAGRVHLARLDLELSGARVAANGEIDGLGDGGTLKAEARVESLGVDLAWRAWPPGVAEAARAWLATGVPRGTVAALHARVGGTVSNADIGTISGVAVSGDLEYRDLEVHFVDTMPPARGVRGAGTFTQSGFDLGVSSGSIEGVAVGPKGKVRISGLDGKKPRIAIDAPVRGTARAVLTVLDAKPIEAAKAMGFPPAEVQGNVDGNLRLDFGLAGPIELPTLGLHARASMSGVALPIASLGWSVADGTLGVEVDARAVTVEGTVLIEGAPARIAWTESLTTQAKTMRTVSVSAAVDDGARQRLGFALEPWLTGPIGVKFALAEGRPAARAPMVGSLELDLTPAAIEVPEISWTKAASAPGRADATLTFHEDHLVGIDLSALRAGGLEASGSASRPAAAERWGDVSLQVGKSTGAGGASAEAEVSLRGNDAGYDVSLTSNDTGAVFDTLGLFADATGGSLTVSGALVLEPERRFDGQVEILNVTISRAPALAKVAGLASLRGLATAFSPSGRGVEFARVTAGLAADGKRTTLIDGSAVGPTLGFVVAGTVDLETDTMSVRGTLVPQLYGLNSLLGKVPLLGRVIGGHRGTGPIGVDFSLEGPRADPRVAVHPLDSLTPSIVTRLVSSLEGLARPR